MATTLTPPKGSAQREAEIRRPSAGGGGSGRGGRDSGDGGNGGRDDFDPRLAAVQRYKLGTWIGMGGIVMVFAAFTSAMVVRSGISGDWRPFQLPGVLWLSTMVLLASSFSLEKAKRLMRRQLYGGLRRWVGVTAILGAVFLILQYAGWVQLAARGIYVASNPSSSFFYVLTAAHGLHLFGGVIALSYVVYRVWRPAVWITREAVVESTALYWHFMDGLWVYLVLLLAFWR